MLSAQVSTTLQPDSVKHAPGAGLDEDNSDIPALSQALPNFLDLGLHMPRELEIIGGNYVSQILEVVHMLLNTRAVLDEKHLSHPQCFYFGSYPTFTSFAVF